MTIESDIQKLEPGKVVELYVLDTTAIGGQINRFFDGSNELKNSLVWQANTYQPFPIKASGFKQTSKGKIPHPKVRVANVDGLVGAEIALYQDLLGAIFTRKRTFVKYLDAVNFPGGVNPTADPNVHYTDEIYSVKRKVHEDPIWVDFELAPPWDVRGYQLPGRQVIANICTWGYRSAECSYTGGAVAKLDDTSTSDPNEDRCGKRLESCKLRFGDFAELPYGGFPGAQVTL